MADAVELDRGRFAQRLERLKAAWTWPLDAILLLLGKVSDDSAEHKAQAMHHWLLGLEFPETAIVIQPSGHVIFLASAKKIDYLRQLEGDNVTFMARRGGGQGEPAVEPAQLAELAAAIRGSKAKATVGMLRKSVHVGAFAEAVVQTMPTAEGLEIVECREEISALLAPKDSSELALLKQSAFWVQHSMQQLLMKRLETVIDSDLKQTNKELCDAVTAALEGEDLLNKWQRELGLDSAELDIVYVGLQSGKMFDLKPAVEPDEELIPMHGTYVLSIGFRYSEYSACISRTILVDPTKRQKAAYTLALQLHSQIVADLKPGALLKDVYLNARATVQNFPEPLLDCFAKTVGFATGLEFKDPQLMLTEKSDREVQAGMAFVISIGFSEADDGPNAKPWAIWLADTVIVPANGGPCEVPTAQCKFAVDDVMYELNDDAGADPPPATAASSSSAPPPARAGAAAAASPRLPTLEEGGAEASSRNAPAPKGKAKGKAAAAKGKGKAKAAPKGKADASPAKPPPPPPPKTRSAAGPPARSAAKPPAAGRKAAAATPEPGTRRASGRDRSRAREAPPARRPPPPVVSDGGSLKDRLRKRNAQTVADMKELAELEEKQIEIRARKLDELRARFCGDGAEGAGAAGSADGRRVTPRKLFEYKCFASPANMPGCPGARPARVQVDLGSCTLLVPINGAYVPFHVSMVKNMSRQSIDRMQQLRVNFFTPGQGKGADEFPAAGGPDRAYVKEMTFRSEEREHLDTVVKMFKEAQKRLRAEPETGTSDAKPAGTTGAKVDLQLLKPFDCLRDLNMRPTMGSGSRRTQGTLEAHANGFRFVLKGSADKVDILYSQVKHAIFEPCESGSLIALIHLHLREQISLGSKRTQDVQFFLEVVSQTEDLGQKRTSSAYDPDELLEEQRERDTKKRINESFRNFCKKVQDLKTCPLKIDIPLAPLAFSGVPHKSNVRLCFSKGALVSLQEWPPICIDMDEVDIVVFERATLTLRDFDMVLVQKNYDLLPLRITMIPKAHFDMIKRYLAERQLVWYTHALSFQWANVMKDINSDRQKFVEEGGWCTWFGDSDAEGEDGADGPESSDFVDSGEEDDEGGDDDAGESDFSAEDADAGGDDSDAGEDDEEEEGLDWDQLEAKAQAEDRRKRDRSRSRDRPQRGAPPPAKRTRR